MGSDFNQDSDNDIPEWLRGMRNGSEDADMGNGDMFSSDSSDQEETPDWLKADGEGEFARPSEPEQEGVPDWLADIRQQEKQEEGPTFMDENEPDEGKDEWLDSIRELHRAETENLRKQRVPKEDSGDYMDKVRKLKEADESGWGDSDEDEDDGWGTSPADEPQDEIAAAWAADTPEPAGGADEPEEDVPDWLSGLPSLDPAEQTYSADEDSDDSDGTPGWLQNMGQQSSIDDEPPTEEEPPAQEEEEPEEEPESELPHVPALSNPPPTTSSLPSWLENLQTSGLVLPEDMRDDQEGSGEQAADTFEYVEEDVSSLLSEAEALPDWLGEGASEIDYDQEMIEEEQAAEQQEAAEPESEALPELPTSTEMGEEPEIEKAELPTWLQAMRPVEAVTSAAEIEEEEEAAYRTEEKVGPLSGLRDVLPAEPHVVHFGDKATPIPNFALTDQQKKYSQLLVSLVDAETKSPPAEKRSVALPQQLLRWVIAIVLAVVLIFTLWFRVDSFVGMPTAGIPAENLALFDGIDNLQPGSRVLVAFEYQPALAGEMESVSAGIINHLLSRQVNLVLFSSQPTGPGLAESFLQKDYFISSEYVQNHQYINLGYLSGGSAALLNFAHQPRRSMPLMDANGASMWDQMPLQGINTLRDFSMVLVITDDPDMARSWVEQVQPVLDPDGNGTGTPLMMAVSAQAEPLVYPYYLTSPSQVSGYVSGLSGGAFYEAHSGTYIVANRYWNAYNVGMLVTVFMIAVGALINLARVSFGSTGKGRP